MLSKASARGIIPDGPNMAQHFSGHHEIPPDLPEDVQSYFDLLSSGGAVRIAGKHRWHVTVSLKSWDVWLKKINGQTPLTR